MTEGYERPVDSLMVREEQELVGVVVGDNGSEVTQFFADADELDSALMDANTQAALQAIDPWADLDWDDAVEELDRIRHESKSSPPLDL